MNFRHRYFEALGLHPTDTDEEGRKTFAATLERTHELRKFEIELYWKRVANFGPSKLSPLRCWAPYIGVVLLGAGSVILDRSTNGRTRRLVEGFKPTDHEWQEGKSRASGGAA